jgi:CheY-like chemotaxis protein
MNTGSEKILVVDDDDTIRDVVSKMLCRLGFEVSADSGETGLALFLKNKFDLVITDFSMSGMDGIHLADYVKEKSPATQVVLMTGADKAVILSKIKGTAVAKVLFKPFTLAEMDVTVQCHGILRYCLNQRNSRNLRSHRHKFAPIFLNVAYSKNNKESCEMNVLLIYPKFPDTFWSFNYALKFIRKKFEE